MSDDKNGWWDTEEELLFEVQRTALYPQEKFQCYCNRIITYTDLPDTLEIQCGCGLFWKVWDDGKNRGIEEVC